MQKIKHILWHGIAAAITAAALFVFTCRYVSAEEISGEEVYFTHSHVAGCKKLESVSCAGHHGYYYHTSEKGTYHCSNCNAQMTHSIEIDVYRCSDSGSTWQQNAYTKCTVCGTIHSTWGGDPGNIHSCYTEKIICGLLQGECTSGVKIVASGAWTNQGVTLEVKRTVLKNDSPDNVTFSWDGGSLFVTENGTYTVNAVNGAGASVTASIEISCIDKIAPVILSVSGNTQGMTASGISVSVIAEDSESGLADMPYSFGGGTTWTAGASFWVEEGRVVSLRVRDKAGNTSERIIKRNDFPYPTPVQTPNPATPTPAPQTTPVPQQPEDGSNGSTQNADTQADPDSGGSKKGGGLSETKNISGGLKNAETNRNDEGEKNSRGKSESGKGGSKEDTVKQNGSYHGGDSTLTRPQPTVLKEVMQEGGKGDSFRVVRMDKAQAGMSDTGTLEEGTAVMASYMQAVTGTGTRYALAGGLSLQEGTKATGPLNQALDRIKARLGLMAGIILSGIGVLLGCRWLWLYSVELYCYDGGSEYRRLGLLYIKKRKKELELYLPDYILTKTGAPRYRLVVKDRLVRRFGKMDLVVHSDEHRLRRPLEECVDFVL